MDHPYTYRLTVQKTIVSQKFELGKGSIVVINLASKQLIEFLRAVYQKDKFAFELSPAAATFLLTNHEQYFQNNIPCICSPSRIDLKFQIVQ